MPSTGINQPILADSTLLIKGKQLKRERTLVQIDSHVLSPQKIADDLIELELGAVDIPLKPGVHSLQVIHRLEEKANSLPAKQLESNAVAFVLCPTIVGEVIVNNLQKSSKMGFDAEIMVDLDLPVGESQKVVLLLNEIPKKSATGGNSAAYMFLAKGRDTESYSVIFPVQDVVAAEYLVRVQVDGAESLLNVDANPKSSTFEQYCDPVVRIS